MIDVGENGSRGGGSRSKGRGKGKVLMELERCQLLDIVQPIVFMCSIAQNKKFVRCNSRFAPDIFDLKFMTILKN